MNKKIILNYLDLVSCTVNDLIIVKADIEKELIIISIFGKETELSITKLRKRTGSKNFINYLKEKINEN